jgi:hypothetical protein
MLCTRTTTDTAYGSAVDRNQTDINFGDDSRSGTRVPENVDRYWNRTQRSRSPVIRLGDCNLVFWKVMLAGR